MPFPGALGQSETLIDLSRTWTRVADSISYVDDRYIEYVFQTITIDSFAVLQVLYFWSFKYLVFIS